MKKLLAVLLSTILTVGAVSASAEVNVKVIVDDKIVKSETVTSNERILVPLRAIMENAEAEVKWYEGTNKIDVTKDGRTITLNIGSDIMNTPDGDITLDAAPMIVGGDTTYLPIRAVCEEFGMTVEWDQGTKTVLVTTNDGSPRFDTNYGMTIEDYAAMYEVTPQEVAEAFCLNYEDIQGMLLTDVIYFIPVSVLAEENGVTVQEMSEIFEVDLTADMPLGEFEGELTLAKYFDYIGVMGSYESYDEAMEDFKLYYSLGDEYTLDTKYKFVRTIIDLVDYGYTDTETDGEELAVTAVVNAYLDAIKQLNSEEAANYVDENSERYDSVLNIKEEMSSAIKSSMGDISSVLQTLGINEDSFIEKLENISFGIISDIDYVIEGVEIYEDEALVTITYTAKIPTETDFNNEAIQNSMIEKLSKYSSEEEALADMENIIIEVVEEIVESAEYNVVTEDLFLKNIDGAWLITD